MSDTCIACESPIAAGGRRWSVPDHEFRRGPAVVYAHCPDCGSLSQVPPPSVAQLAAWYPADYFGRGSSFRLRRALQNVLLRRRAREALRALPPSTDGPRRLLDFGAGDGSFLRVVKRLDPGVEAIAYDKMAEKYATPEAEPFQRTDRLDRIRNRVHVTTMHHVIEHLSSFEDSLREASAALAAGGVLLGETPNSQSAELRLFGAAWGGFHAPRHTVIFSATGLGKYLERAGLEVVFIRKGSNPAQAAISLAALLRLPEPRFLSSWLLPIAVPLAILERLAGNGNVLRFLARKAA